MLKAALMVAAIAVLATGCTTTHYRREIVVKKDADGKIVETIDTETIEQPNRQEEPHPFVYIKRGSK